MTRSALHTSSPILLFCRSPYRDSKLTRVLQDSLGGTVSWQGALCVVGCAAGAVQPTVLHGMCGSAGDRSITCIPLLAGAHRAGHLLQPLAVQ